MGEELSSLSAHFACPLQTLIHMHPACLVSSHQPLPRLCKNRTCHPHSCWYPLGEAAPVLGLGSGPEALRVIPTLLLKGEQ